MALLDANPGDRATCAECGFSALVPANMEQEATEPASKKATPLDLPPATPVSYLAPLAYIFGVAAIATFFLAHFFLPFILAAGAAGVGLAAYVKADKSRQGLVAALLGGAGFLTGLIYLFLA